ncbi:MAG: hypothetical protein HY922_03475 [Elusimicrobia bacterium]|nr:hypothetical protein [Elusimicrobiota bacterium]
MTVKTQPALPAFYDPANAGRSEYAPDQQKLFAAAAEWRKERGIRPSAADRFALHLLLIDAQKDFCFPSGALYVAGRSGKGAIDDSVRIAEFVYRNLGRITNITTTLDTHFAYQIFFPSFWIDREDRPLAPFREITAEEVARGEARPSPMVAKWLCGGNYAWLLKQALHYCAELELKPLLPGSCGRVRGAVAAPEHRHARRALQRVSRPAHGPLSADHGPGLLEDRAAPA